MATTEELDRHDVSSYGRSPVRRPVLAAAVVGLIAGAAFLAAAEVVALFLGGAGSPLVAVGGTAIDLAPKWVKDTMVAVFGTGDKAALFGIMFILFAAATAWAGVLERRRRLFGVAVVVVGAVLALLAVTSRTGSGMFDGAPTVVGAGAAIIVLRSLTQRLRTWEHTAADPGTTDAAGRLARRSFLRSAVVVGAVAVVAGGGARIANAVTQASAAARRAVRLPAPATTERAVPSGADLDIDGLTPYVTPNGDFYRIDTALRVPTVDPADWTLRITGAVEQEVELSWDELLALPLEEHMATLSCVSNEVGGDLVGNALWLGYPIRELLARARPHASADMVLSTSVDGFTAGTPLDVLQDEGTAALVAVGMNGEPLPPEHGFPARLVVPGLYGYVSATKWVTELQVTRFADAQGYWTPRGWSERGPVKTGSRIDTPANGSQHRAGDRVAIAGVAWHPHTGIRRVQVRIDDGDWQDATLADSVSADTWRQWVFRWTATSGDHRVTVRATTEDGEVQTSVERPPAPNGATGWDGIRISVD